MNVPMVVTAVLVAAGVMSIGFVEPSTLMRPAIAGLVLVVAGLG